MKSHSDSEIPLLFIIITVNSLNLLNHSRISAKDPDLFCGYIFPSVLLSSRCSLFPIPCKQESCTKLLLLLKPPKMYLRFPSFSPALCLLIFNSSAIFLLLLPCIGDFFVFFYSLPHLHIIRCSSAFHCRVTQYLHSQVHFWWLHSHWTCHSALTVCYPSQETGTLWCKSKTCFPLSSTFPPDKSKYAQ